MRLSAPHPWDLTPKEAMALQTRLRHRVVAEDRFGEVRTVAGLDVGYDRSDLGHDQRQRHLRAAVAVLTYPELQPVEEATAEGPAAFPYVPGLLSFREIPPLLEALDRLRRLPDLLLCDGQGYAHPRRFGLACHLGVVVDRPAVGVAKSRFIGEHPEPPAERGAWVPLTDGGEVIGAVLRTRSRVKPVYLSIGHRVSLETAIAFTLATAPRYRLPEPLRRAHRLALG